MKSNYDVFLSYRRNGGKDVASVLNTAIESEGYKTYFDVDENYTGDYFKNIEQAVINSDLFILVVSEGSLERFKNKEDISRFELEKALEYNKEILPITLIGDTMFKEISDPTMPECVRSIKNLNTRFYLHESKNDTINYVLELCEKVRVEKFKALSENLTSSLKSFLKNIEEKIEGSFSCCDSIENKNKLKYTGKLKDDIPYGEGVIKDISTGTLYEVNFYGNAELFGQGKIIKGGKTIYEGEIRYLKPNGEGTLYELNGVYEGILNNGLKDTSGSYRFKDGSYYNGDWKEGNITGYGYMRYSDGCEYRGMFLNGKRNGIGTLIKPLGDKFEGTWSDDLLTEGVRINKNIALKGKNFNKNLEVSGFTQIFDLKNNKIIFSGNSKNGKFEEEGKIVLDKNKLENLNLPHFNIKPLNLNTKLSNDRNYILEGEFKEGKLNKQGNIVVKDDEGRLIYTKTKDTYTLNTLGVKYEEYLQYKVVFIHEKGRDYEFSLKGDYFLADVKFELNGKTSRQRVLLQIDKDDNARAFIEPNEKVKPIEVNILELYEEDYPTIIKEKLHKFFDKDYSSEGVDLEESLLNI